MKRNLSDLKHEILLLTMYCIVLNKSKITCQFLRQKQLKRGERQCLMGTSVVKMETALGVLESQNQHLENNIMCKLTRDTDAEILHWYIIFFIHAGLQ